MATTAEFPTIGEEIAASPRYRRRMVTPDADLEVAAEPAGADTAVPSARVAVIVVTYNSSDVIGGLLDCLPRALDGVDADVIVVDNASVDDSVRRARAAGVVDRVLVSERNRGYAAAINDGARTAEHWDALLVLNPDLRPSPGMASQLLAASREPRVGLCVPKLVEADGAMAWSLRREPSAARAWAEALMGGTRAARHGWGELVVPGDDPAATKERADWATGAAMLITRPCWDDVGPWDETFFLYGEETDYALRARDRGWALRQAPDAVATHLRGEAPTNPRLWSLLQCNRVRLVRARRGFVAGAWFRVALIVNAALRSSSPAHAAALRALLPGGGRNVVSEAGGMALRRRSGR